MISDERHTPSSRRMQAWETQELDASDLADVEEAAEDLLISDEIAATELATKANEPRQRFEPMRPDPIITPYLPVPAATDDRGPDPVSIGTLQAAHPSFSSIPHALPQAPCSIAPVAIAVDNDDAYFHPGGRILSVADATIEGWRVEPTMMLRRVRARSLRSWAVLGLVALALPLLLIFVIVGVSTSEASTPAVHREARTADVTKTPLAPKVVTSHASKTGVPVRMMPTAPAHSFLSNRRK